MMNSQSYKKLKTRRNAKKISIKTLKHEGREGNTNIHKEKKNKIKNFVYLSDIFVPFVF